MLQPFTTKIEQLIILYQSIKKGIPEGLIQQPQTPGPQGAHGQQQAPAQNQNQQAPQGQIAITQEQFILIQQLIASPAFANLRQQAMTNPETLPALLQMLQQNYPTLSTLFHQNPQLLIAILSGQFDGQNAQNLDQFGGEEGEDYEEEATGLEHSPEDNANIQTVV